MEESRQQRWEVKATVTPALIATTNFGRSEMARQGFSGIYGANQAAITIEAVSVILDARDFFERFMQARNTYQWTLAGRYDFRARANYSQSRQAMRSTAFGNNKALIAVPTRDPTLLWID